MQYIVPTELVPARKSIRSHLTTVLFAVALAIAEVDRRYVVAESKPIVMRLDMTAHALPRMHRPLAYRASTRGSRWPVR